MKKMCIVEGCTQYRVARGLCRKHYMRQRRHGDPTATPRFDPIDKRFWKYVNKTQDCWLWTGAVARGYGHFVISQRPTKTQKAHRYAYELEIGPIPNGLFLHHKCKNTLCVNPNHLQPVTPKEHSNIHKPDSCKHGHPFDKKNTYIYKSGPKKGRRKCRACERDRMRKKRAHSKGSL